MKIKNFLLKPRRRSMLARKEIRKEELINQITMISNTNYADIIALQSGYSYLDDYICYLNRLRGWLVNGYKFNESKWLAVQIDINDIDLF